MARKSIQELVVQADTTLADNIVGDISAADVRNMVKDFLNAIKPAYGQLTILTPSTQALTTTPTILDFTGAGDSDPTETTSSIVSNTITRSDRGTSRVVINVDIETASNREVTMILYKNGAPTSWRIMTSGSGTGSPVSVSLVAVDYADPAANYSVFVQTDAAASVIFNNGVFLLEIVPVNSYA
jgi:2-phospho-L-lactate guanylyltransferase (CobY/MobA/RfbA family)